MAVALCVASSSVGADVSALRFVVYRASGSVPLSIDDLTFKSRNPFLVDLPEEETLQAQAAIRIQVGCPRILLLSMA